jgi:hypothetical protein
MVILIFLERFLNFYIDDLGKASYNSDCLIVGSILLQQTLISLGFENCFDFFLSLALNKLITNLKFGNKEMIQFSLKVVKVMLTKFKALNDLIFFIFNYLE